MRIIYEDDNQLIVYKEAGVLTQSARSFDIDLTSEVMTYRKKKKEPAYAAVINRLDRPVSGLVLFAKNQKEAGRLSKLLQEERFNKQYYAVVQGIPERKQAEFTDYLLKNGKENISAVVSADTSGAKQARLEYEVVQVFEDSEGKQYTVVKIHLITGRHHQIRVQFASRGLPLAGDGKYMSIYQEQFEWEYMQAAKRIGEYDICKKSKPMRRILHRNEIALCAASLTIEGKEYTVEPPFYSTL